jgi:hypothetical protein
MALSPSKDRDLIAYTLGTQKSGPLTFRKPLLTSAFQDRSVIRSNSEAGAYPHLDLTWAVALGQELWKKYRGAMAYWIVIVSAEEVAAPGFTAASDAVPAVARSEAGMATVRWVASTIVVVR